MARLEFRLKKIDETKTKKDKNLLNKQNIIT